MTRVLSFIGIIGLIGALLGAALLGTRAFPRADVTTDISSEALQPQATGVDAVVSQSDSTAGPTFTDTLADDSLILTGLALAAAFGIALLVSILKTVFATRATRIGCFLIAGTGTLVLVLGAVVGIFWLLANLSPMAAPLPEDIAQEPAAEEPEEEAIEPPTEEPAEESGEEEFEYPTPTAMVAEEATPTAELANTPIPPLLTTATEAPTEQAASPAPTVEAEPTQSIEAAPGPDPDTEPSRRSVIEVEWPVQMEIDRADTVRIELIRISEGVYVPTAEVAGNTIEAATPIPVGTPGAPIEEAFGVSYHAYATASLVGTTFDIERASLERRSLTQDRIVWEWNLTPTTKGTQALNANIVIEWEPDDGGATIERQIWQARLETEVKKRLIPTPQVGLVTAISGIVGSGFSIPWIFDRLQDFVFGRIQDWLYDRAKAGVQRRAERRRKKRQSKGKK